MSIEQLKPSYVFDEERIEELRRIIPEAFTDGQINWDTLREALGEYFEEDGPDSEHYGLFWPGKKQARRLASIPSKGTLIPVYGEGLKADGTPDTDGFNDSRNVFIEGENLEVLKIMQKSYAGRIKMIYIDPPYNTGNDFIYEDDFSEPLQEYLKRTGQIDEEGRSLTSNTRADGRFHSKWLSMMDPRLRLARNLLRDDGVIFVSIDDNEVHHLRMMMNEIFGEENFLAELVWKKKYIGGKHAKHFVDLHEYILVFSRSVDSVSELLMERPAKEKEKFEFVDEFVNERGKFYIRPLKSNLGERRTLVYPIKLPDGTYIKTQWMVAESTFQELIKNGRIIFKEKKDGGFNVYRKFYENDNEGRVKVPTIIDDVANADGKIEIKQLFNIKEGREIPFENPKPTKLLKHLIKPSVDCEDIILDFFSGSGTTAQAIFDLNNEGGGNRKFILIQMPELCDSESEAFKAGFKNISEIAKERIRCVVSKMKKENLNERLKDQDIGFIVLKLTLSHYKDWQNYQGTNSSELESQLSQFISPLVESWKAENLIYEVMLIEGFPLDSAILALESVTSNLIMQITSVFNEHRLLVCFDKKIVGETIQCLNLKENDVFICLDSAISDEDKVRLADKGMIKTI